MTKKELTNVAASVHARLRNAARERGRPFDELLQYFAMERFLYRLSRTDHARRFILKGALMFVVWDVPVGRPTRDIDLLGAGDPAPESVAAIMKDACREDGGGDGLEFDPSIVKAKRIRLDAEYEGVRAEVQGNLGATRVRMHIDVGFGDATTPVSVEVDYPVILDLPAPRLRAYAKESVVAEKFEAMVALGRINSRMKDFYDVWFLSRTFDFEGRILARAVGSTFARRGSGVPTEPLPLTDEFAEGAEKVAQWTAFVRRTRLVDLAPRELGDVVRELRGFLGPVSRALSDGREFDSTWNAPGPWESTGRKKV